MLEGLSERDEVMLIIIMAVLSIVEAILRFRLTAQLFSVPYILYLSLYRHIMLYFLVTFYLFLGMIRRIL